MKKYLMTGIAALTLGGMITSCSHDMDQYTGGDVTENIQKDYETKFVSRFGEPASNQDWGFGSSSVAGVRGGTRAVTGITFPTFKDGQCPSMPTKYKNTLAEAITDGAQYAKEYQNYKNGDIIYINTDYQQLNNPQNYSDLTIYVDGNVTYNGQTNQNGNGTVFCVTENSTLKLGQVCERLTIYLAPKAKLDLSECTCYVWNQETNTGGNVSGATFTKEGAALYMSSESSVEGGALFFKDSYTVLNEGGTIAVDELHVENGAVLYNKNEITATGVIALRNTNGEIDNFGTMEGASMTLDANARFYNVAGGTVNISGLTKINNNGGNNAWMNGGQFNTGSFEITGGCQDPAAFNNCHMEVDGEFFMNHGNFVLDGGAAVECGSFEWQSDNFFHMGGKALLKVTGELLANNQNTGYGFYGDDTDYAVIQAGSIVKGSEGKFRAAYFGNLFIDTNNHFEQGRSSADGTWYYFDDTVKFSFDDNSTSTDKKATKAENFSINIPADNTNVCTPGYTWGDEIVRVIAEDLTINDVKADFDFNDVVFDVIWNKKKKGEGGKVSVKVLAAGGELTLYVGGTPTSVDGVQTVNSLFQLANPDKTIGEKDMLNTIRPKDDPSKDYKHEYKPYLYELDNTWWSGTTINEIAKSINIHVWKGGSLVSLTAEPGKPAAKIAVGTDFDWCDERQNIDEKFENFTGFVKGEYSWDTWYKNQNQNQ